MSTDNFNIFDVIIAFWRLRRLMKYVHKQDTILDFGCGYQAFFMKHIQRDIRRGIGIDAHLKPKRIGKKIILLKYKFEEVLPFKKNYFDKVFMLAVLEHLELLKVNTLFKEIYRVLVPNGQLILTTPTPRSKTLLKFLAFTLNLISKDEIGDHKKYYGKSDINIICKKANFKIVHNVNFMLGMNSLYVLKKI